MSPANQLVWKDEWNTGFASIDQQHKKILLAIKAMDRSFSQDTDQAIVEKLFSALEAYTKVHFSFEEKIMERVKYPQLEAQKKEHQTFIEHIQDFRNRSKDPLEFNETMSRVQSYLLDWLINHVLEMDMEYKAYFKKAGVK